MTALPLATAPLSPPLRADEFGPQGRRALWLGVLAAHGLGAWALLQVDGVRQAVVEAAPVMVQWLAPPAPQPAPPPPPRAQAAPAPRPRPVLASAAPPAAPAPVWTAPAPSPEPPPPVPSVAAPTAPTAVVAPPAPAAPPAAPKQLPSSAVQYLVPPALVVPLASRRLNEQGTVWLRLVVDVNGLPQRVTLHQSSGFARLDQQALQAMRAARFKPYTEQGVALEWTAIAPLAYELE